MEDNRARKFNPVKIAITLWESCVIPYMLYNASTWMKIKEKDVEELEKLQNYFCNMILSVQKCPATIMLWDLGLASI